MLRQKYVASTHCHPIYAVINLYTVHIVIQAMGINVMVIIECYWYGMKINK